MRHRIRLTLLAVCLASGAAVAARYPAALPDDFHDQDHRSTVADRRPNDKQMTLTDFEDRSAASQWYTVNDNVMGGRSSGGFEIRSGKLVFSGVTNTDGGGFSSIRGTCPLQDLTGYDGIRLRVLGDGRTYRFRLETSNGVTYFAPVPTGTGGRWETAEIPFERFEPRRRGRPLDGPPLDRSKIENLGLMIYDRRDGPFRLEVDWIEAY